MATPPLSDAEIITRLAKLDGWERDGDAIKKTFKLKDYASGLAFACAVGMVAENLDHHPDLLITYKKVQVRYTTHDAGNKLSYKDFDAAEAVEALRYPAG